MPVDLSERPLPLSSPAPAQIQTYDIAIVGGGIVGLTCACALKESGLRVAVIEAQSAEQAASRQRAYAFSPVSANILKSLGLWDAAGRQLTPFQRVKLSDADYPKAITFRPADGRSDAVYYSAEHGVLMSALQSAVAQASNIDYWCESKILETQVNAQGNLQRNPQSNRLSVVCGEQRYEFHARLLVGADGARSVVRDRANIKTLGWQYWQSCITAVLAPEKPHEYTAYEKFWPSGPFAILPLPNNLCQIVWTAPHAEAKALLALPRAQFLAELQARYGDQMGRLTLVNEPTLFPVQLMQSQDYVQAGVALIGDAAHCCHPVGGQGLNMGIRDAVALAEVLVQAAQAGEDWSSLKVLKRYERWRKRENWFTLSLTDLLNRAFSNRFWPLVIARRWGIWLLDGIGPFKRLILQLMTGFFGKLPAKAK
jgi:2-octaprenyl-6-methoxyphenol hydroxylase